MHKTSSRPLGRTAVVEAGTGVAATLRCCSLHPEKKEKLASVIMNLPAGCWRIQLSQQFADTLLIESPRQSVVANTGFACLYTVTGSAQVTITTVLY